MMSFRFTLFACTAITLAFVVEWGVARSKDFHAANVAKVVEPIVGDPVIWTDQQVARWAYDSSPTARILDAERVAVAKQIRPKNDQDRAGAGLIQAVLRELALHQRNEAAADALSAYYRYVGTKALFDPLRKIAPVLEDLQHLAETATNLELPDGDPEILEDQRLQYEDQWFQLEFGLQRIESRLCQFTNQSINATVSLELVSPLPNDFHSCDGIWIDTRLEHDVELLIEQAFANRKDLAAIRALCRCLNEDSLPAARKLLGILAPGAGIDLASGLKGSLLALGHHGDGDDLAARRAQCQQLIQDRKRQIERDVRDSVLELQTVQARLRTITQRWSNKAKATERIALSAEYGMGTPGTIQQSQIELFQLEAEKIMLEQDLAEAVVKLRRTVGCVLDRYETGVLHSRYSSE